MPLACEFCQEQHRSLYNEKIAYAAEITPDNWYTILAKPDVSFAISDPTSDPGRLPVTHDPTAANKQYGKTDIFTTRIDQTVNRSKRNRWRLHD
jgi:hypothetical protein